ncbi:hypothetical protein Alsa2_CDS0136 [Staphylococcus phage Alsa_2]|nr:hypothetical protein Alsa2_CDS0136 [Staphylococcus phage Alsa_2]
MALTVILFLLVFVWLPRSVLVVGLGWSVCFLLLGNSAILHPVILNS